MTSPCVGVFALLLAPVVRVLVPVLHDLVEPAAVQHAPHGANVLDVVAKQARHERAEAVVVDVTVERLVHSEHELGHEVSIAALRGATTAMLAEVQPWPSSSRCTSWQFVHRTDRPRLLERTWGPRCRAPGALSAVRRKAFDAVAVDE